MNELQQAIDKLRSSPHYKELAAYEPPFNPFEIASVTHRELTHSSVLAWLLRDEANKEFRQKFVAQIAADKPELNLDLSVLKDPGDHHLKPKIVKTEKGDKTSRIDVFTHFESLDLVIGIEVKVWADEQPDQVERYQKFLCQNYSDYKKVVVFLTPTGSKPKTANEDNIYVPVLAMSWGFVSKIIREMRAALGNENDFRMQFSQHLEKNIAINEAEGQRIVRELLSEGDNLRIINEITRKMETWEDKEGIEGDDKFNVEMVQKIIANMSSLQISLECEFWRVLREQLKKQLQEQLKLQLQDKELEFQLYQSDDLKPEVIKDDKLKEYIKWGYGGLGLTFRISGSSLNDDHEVACRITYDRRGHRCLYYGFVLCKKGNIEERVKIELGDEYHKEYLAVGTEILDHGDPNKEPGWLRWKEHADEEICFANGPKLFDTLVKIKERKKNNVIKNLAEEICGVAKKISEEIKKKANEQPDP